MPIRMSDEDFRLSSLVDEDYKGFVFNGNGRYPGFLSRWAVNLSGTSIAWVVLSMLLALACTSFPQERSQAEQLLQEVGRTYRNLSSYHFESVATDEMDGEEKDEKTRTTLVVAAVKPGKMRVEIKDSTTSLWVLSDGQTTWIYSPAMKQYIRKRVVPEENDHGEGIGGGAGLNSAASRLVEAYSRIADNIREARLLSEESVELEGKSIACHVVQVKYANKSPDDSEELSKTFWIDKARYLVLREVSTLRRRANPSGGPGEIRRTITFTLARVNGPIPESFFVLTPPAEARQVEEFGRSASKENEAADFTLTDLQGRSFNLREQRGKAVLLNFWATWCGPCRDEMPYIEKLYRDFKDKGLIVLGVNDEEPEVARSFLAENEITFPSLVDERGGSHWLYRVAGIPTTILIDKEGKIAARLVGYSSGSEDFLRAALKKVGIE